MINPHWHNLSLDKVAQILRADLNQGLSEVEVRERQREFGKNLLPEEKPLSWLRILLEQFKSPLIYILLIAGIITLILKEYADSIVIFGAVFINALVGFLQENKASKALKGLRKIVKIKAQVIRQGNPKLIDSSNIVPGDVFILNPGDKVPADGRILEADNLETNEMVLTGEWLSAEKHSNILPGTTPLADRDNMVYMGTIVENGKGKVVCTETGSGAEIGKIAIMMKETKEEKTPLQKKLAHFSKIIAIIIAIVCIGIFVEGMLTLTEIEFKERFKEMFITAIAVAVAAIPEGLPVSMTVILALGMQRILKKKGLTRSLLATETLGSTSIVCTDKTLTLTEGKMEISETLSFESQVTSQDKKKWYEVFCQISAPDQVLIMTIAVLCNEAFIENPKDLYPFWRIQGRPTDKSLLLGGARVGLERPKLEKKYSKIAELPFSTENKFIASLYKKEDERILYISGAPEKIIGLCSSLQIEGKQEDLKESFKQELFGKLEGLTGKGLRVIAVAYKQFANSQKLLLNSKAISNLCFVGFIGLRDPIRKGVKEAFMLCRGAGIRPVLVTGDHLLTAKAIARELGLKTEKENVIKGQELDQWSDVKLQEKIRDIEVYARVEPHHKLRIIKAWQKIGEVVAMTGDGINDAPALKQADIGVALGSGTDVAKESSDLVLLDDSFSVIVAAVEEGRRVIDNIRKVMTYLLSDSFSEIVLIVIALLFGLPLPISAVQILWVNLVEDGLPDIALAFEPKEKDIMKRKPEGHEVPLLTREMRAIIFIIGLITDFMLLGLFFWLWEQNHDIAYVRTMVFACLTIDSLFYAFSCKSLRRNLWHINPFSNKLLVGAVVFGVLMLVLAIYLPVLGTLLKTVSLSFNDWLIVLGIGVMEIVLIEATKHYFIVRKEV